MLQTDLFYLTKDSETNNVGTFSIGPLPRGYGYTVANALRRILLSSLKGAAITSIKIDGVDHEYATLEGVTDDILTILLRLKKVVFNSDLEGVTTLNLDVENKSEKSKSVTAGDIQISSNLEIVNKDYEITSLAKGAKLSAQLTVESGSGYRMADHSKREEIGAMPVDAIFSPVENVEIEIGNTRVGHRTDFDKITMHVTTNGSKTPSDAIREAISIYHEITSRLLELAGGEMKQKSEETETKTEASEAEQDNGTGAIAVDELNFSTRLKNALTNSAITDLRVLDGKTREELLEIKGMGEKSTEELIAAMRDNDLTVLE
ncbi:MAG: DNA-directed RNA polymerase subunit alpha [Candidatus Dojkabacteria bacterium]